MTTRPPLLLIGTLALAVLPACGHKGDPRPPLRRTPPAPTEFHLAQRGAQLEVTAAAPATSVDGVALPALALEFLHGSGKADLEKTGARTLVKAVPGGRVTTTLPLPAPGTLVRVTARAVAGGQRSARTLTLALVAQPALEPPRELQARAAAEGVTLTWEGETPKEVPPVTPSVLGLPAGAAAPPSSGTATPAATPPAPAAPATPDTTKAPPAAEKAPAEKAPSAETPKAKDEKERDEKEKKAPVSPAAGAEPTPPAPPPPPKRRSGFFVYRRVGEGPYGVPLTEEPFEGRTATDTQAPLGARLCYVVRAVGSTEPLIESAASDEVCLERRDVTPPAAPAGLTVLPRAGGLELLWSPSAEEDLAGYRVYRSTAGGAPERLAELAVSQTSYLDTAAARGASCRYTLTAFDRAGNESAPSEPVEATLP